MIFSILICAALFVVGFLFIYRYAVIRINLNRAVNWPKTMGKVTSSNIEEDNTRTPTGKAEYSYIPHVDYTYNVSGQAYKGSRIIFGKAYFDFITATNVRDKYPEGAEAEIYYNPANPAQSVLLPKSKVGLVSWVPGVFFTLVGIVVAVVLILEI